MPIELSFNLIQNDETPLCLDLPDIRRDPGDIRPYLIFQNLPSFLLQTVRCVRRSNAYYYKFYYKHLHIKKRKGQKKWFRVPARPSLNST
jgi:hypothetical protein